MKVSALNRRQSCIFPIETINRNHFKQYRSLPNLSKLTSLSNPHSESYFCVKKKLNFIKDRSLKNTMAKDYIYLGALIKTVFNQTGLTLDEEGNLLFIKGKRSDLFVGLYNAYINPKSNTILTYEMNLNTSSHTIQFQSLFINKKGHLIAIDKKEHRPYSIHFENPKQKDPSAPNEIKVILCYEPEEKKIEEDLTFEYVDNECKMKLSFYLKGEKLYCIKHYLENNNKTYFRNENEIILPLGQQWKIRSIKKTVNFLQIEIKNEFRNKTEIVYLNPEDIHLETRKIKKISHKPPQNFSSGFGNDPYESCFSGQPFSSVRIGNFSSKYIPLLSSVVDKFRTSLKRVKSHYYKGGLKSCFKESCRSIDPGGEYVYKHIKENLKFKNEFQGKKGIYETHKLQFMQNKKALEFILTENNAYVSRGESLSQILPRILLHLDYHETLVCSSVNELGLFFGVAAAGLPFSPGWFAGIVGIFKKQYEISITKEKDYFHFQFVHRVEKALIPLVGTGQGLEDNNKLLTLSSVNVVTVLPVEANLILIANVISGSSFGFNIKAEQLVPYIENLTNEKALSWLENILIDESEIEAYKESNFTLKLETKSELRGELGFMANNQTYLVLPRTALGIRLALQLIAFQKRVETGLDNKKQPHKYIFTLSIMSLEVDLFRENKIMPITMKSDYMGTNNVWCFPMPLPEEYKAIASDQKALHVSRRSREEEASVNEMSHYLRIEKEKLPLKLQLLIQDLYPFFSEKTAQDIRYQYDGVFSKLSKIKLFGIKNNFLFKLREHQERINAQPATIIDRLGQLCEYYSNLSDMMKSVDWIIKNSGRNSMHKASQIEFRCTYQMTENSFKKLKNHFFEALRTIELKSKNEGIMSLDTPFHFETTTLNEIHATLNNQRPEHGSWFVLKKVEIIRHSYAENRLETLQFAILRARKTTRISLIQPIGTIELECDDNGENFKVVNCVSRVF